MTTQLGKKKARVKALAARRFVPKGKKATIALAVVGARDIELGKEGSRWKHGYVPLNAAAVALKNHKHPGAVGAAHPGAVKVGSGHKATVAAKRAAVRRTMPVPAKPAANPNHVNIAKSGKVREIGDPNIPAGEPGSKYRIIDHNPGGVHGTMTVKGKWKPAKVTRSANPGGTHDEYTLPSGHKIIVNRETGRAGGEYKRDSVTGKDALDAHPELFEKKTVGPSGTHDDHHVFKAHDTEAVKAEGMAAAQKKAANWTDPQSKAWADQNRPGSTAGSKTATEKRAANNVKGMSSQEIDVALRQSGWDDTHKNAMRAELRSRGQTPDERPTMRRAENYSDMRKGPGITAQDVADGKGDGPKAGNYVKPEGKKGDTVSRMGETRSAYSHLKTFSPGDFAVVTDEQGRESVTKINRANTAEGGGRGSWESFQVGASLGPGRYTYNVTNADLSNGKTNIRKATSDEAATFNTDAHATKPNAPAKPSDDVFKRATEGDWNSRRAAVAEAAAQGRATHLPAGAKDNATARVLIDGREVGQASTLSHDVRIGDTVDGRGGIPGRAVNTFGERKLHPKSAPVGDAELFTEKHRTKPAATERVSIKDVATARPSTLTPSAQELNSRARMMFGSDLSKWSLTSIRSAAKSGDVQAQRELAKRTAKRK